MALRAGSTADVRDALLAARARTLRLADAYEAKLGDRAPGIDYHAEMNPPLWELGHIAWFQAWWIGRNLQRERGTACDPDHPRAPSTLADADAWYDSSRVAHRSRWALPLPEARATRTYLAATLDQTLALLEALPSDADEDALYFFRLVAAHEMMHAEAAVYMAQALGIAVHGEPQPAARSATTDLQLPRQRFLLGAPAGGFVFDNESRAHPVEVGPAAIDSEAVTWARFLPFVEAGGYAQPRWWTDAGQAWLQRHAQASPRYLRRTAGGAWETKRHGTWRALDPSLAAVHLTAHEAQAWSNWAGRRLPTEAEWECAALTLPGFGAGQVWEWTASAFEPYPGFEPHPYRDYSAPWFGTRRVLRGACFATDPALRHVRYRNFFEPHRNDVFAGFRTCAA